MTLLWILLAFLLGGLPFAVWLGRLAGVDPRTVRDGNPGTFNVWKLAGWQVGVPVLVRGWPWETFAVWGITAVLLAWGYRRNLTLPLRRENRPHA
jgi:glycerol-3-phosphate acyltransferase PlsY